MVDWSHPDACFLLNHAKNVTPEFDRWWLEKYGPPEDTDPSHDEQETYWKLKACALMGWMAGVEHQLWLQG